MSEENIGRFRVSMDQLKAMIPVGRTGVADDIAHTVVWLASEGAGYVSGQTIGVNGGRVVS
jgi:2-hydroxycyclohexanecarboxyl-CoA dehydrogenase